jgi:hypothetical protein
MYRDAASVIRQPVIPQHPYQSHLQEPSVSPLLSSSTVRYWSDYNRIYHHPRSLVQLETTSLAATTAPMQDWNFGLELFGKEDHEHDLLDRDFRFFAEECDQMQGVTVFAGMDDAWGGFAKGYIERLRDELGKRVIWVWGLHGTVERSEMTAVKLYYFIVLTPLIRILGKKGGKTPKFDEITSWNCIPSIHIDSSLITS